MASQKPAAKRHEGRNSQANGQEKMGQKPKLRSQKVSESGANDCLLTHFQYLNSRGVAAQRCGNLCALDQRTHLVQHFAGNLDAFVAGSFSIGSAGHALDNGIGY